MTLGVVLAGGRSTRFGSEKAVALVDGEPMIAHVAAVLARGCEEVAVSAPNDSGAAAWARSRGFRVLPDPPGAPDGPLADVLAGVTWTREQGAALLATVPCDTPRLPADFVDRLGAELGDAAAAFAVTSEGAQPLCALWRATLIDPLAITLTGGAHPAIRVWLRSLGAAEVRFEDPGAFANLNTPVTNTSARRI